MVQMMGSSWGISEQGWRKGPWTHEEDKLLVEYVNQHGEGRWSCVSKIAGLNRSGKSCRLRWVNYLRPGLKKGHITPQEEGIIIELHALWGNKWSTIARYLPGRTDNEIKNYWRTHFKKRKPSDSHNNNNKQQRRKVAAKQEQESDGKSAAAESSPDQASDGKNDAKQGTEVSAYPNTGDIHQFIPPAVFYQDNYYTDFIPVDSYLWGGLWNLDDQNCCSKIAIQNQANIVGNSSLGGDHATNCMHNGGQIF